MRVLVTGASGFVGSAVVGKLLSGGHEVVGLVRNTPRCAHLASRGVELVEGDMVVPDSYVPVVEGVDVVVHAAQLATPGRLTPARAEQLFAADALMTESLARACITHGRRLVYTGGCFDWGDHGEELIDETTPLTPSPMGVGHARQAAFLDRLHETDGLDVVRLSPGFVYGPGGLFATAFVDQALKNRLRCIGNGRNWWSCIEIDDLADAYVAALQAPSGSAYAVVDDEPIRLRQLTDLITDALGRKRVGAAPVFLMNLILGKTLTSSLVTSFRISNERIRRELDWAPKQPTFGGAVERTVESYLATLDRR